ncbi:uncharacterized protein BP5553_00550 [Venustampulla echinocandica]|uniref:Uncharacterized protein n=1 Tax=Venustampulla echinocandica TaxID=2656787 RepID=A0A370TYH2_9HELO|nr:uncharacterized protein BP5553_00550 [Venustampulla echinocandica]RDL40571.1 hypothetical protein BP5553_00550 [Venustampulla echinocandica]
MYLDGVDSYVLEEDVAMRAYQTRDTRFSGCFDGCNYQDQLGSAYTILDLCNAFEVAVDFPEAMVPIAKRQGLESGSRTVSLIATRSAGSTSTRSTSRVTSQTIGRQTLTETSLGTTTTSTPKETTPSETTPANNNNNPTSTPTETSLSNNGDPASSSPHGGLSSAAKIAIGCGVAIPIVIVLLILGAGFYFWRRRRQGKHMSKAGETGEVPETNDRGLPELMAPAVDIKKPDQVQYNPPHQGRLPVEAGGVPINEMNYNTVEAGGAPINELHHNTVGRIPESEKPFELHGHTAPTPVYDSTAHTGDNSVSPAHRTSAIARKSIPAPSVPPATSSASTFPPPWSGGDGAGNWDSVGQNVSPPQEATTSMEQSSQRSIPQGVTSPGGSEDAELMSLELEVEQVRQRKERLRHMQELEAKEEELLRRIDEKKKAASGAGGAVEKSSIKICLTTLKPLAARFFPGLLVSNQAETEYTCPYCNGTRLRSEHLDPGLSAINRTAPLNSHSDTSILPSPENFDMENLPGEGSSGGLNDFVLPIQSNVVDIRAGHGQSFASVVNEKEKEQGDWGSKRWENGNAGLTTIRVDTVVEQRFEVDSHQARRSSPK